MNYGRQLVIWAVAFGLLLVPGCAKKKPQLPPQAKAPAEPIATPLPDEISETVEPPPPLTPKHEAPKQEEPPPKPVKRRPKKKPTPPPASQASTTPAPAAPTTTGNETIASARPPANPAAEPSPDVAIAADVTTAQLNRQKQSTAQLLDETEKTISGLNNHTLSHDEEEMLSQIRSYVSQSRKATTDGDFERAYNLATKAHLLSDALVKK